MRPIYEVVDLINSKTRKGKISWNDVNRLLPKHDQAKQIFTELIGVQK